MLGQENKLLPPYASPQPNEDRRLRGLGRAERVDRRGRKLALPAGVLGRSALALELLGGLEAELVAYDS